VRNSTEVSVSATASNNSRDSSEPALAIEELVAHLLEDLVESSWQPAHEVGGHQVAFGEMHAMMSP
jgi:hypothetical protein